MSIPARRGRIRVSLEILRDALGLPTDMHVHGFATTPDDLFAPTITLAVSGPQCPEVSPGAQAPDLMVRLVRHSNGRVSVDAIEGTETLTLAPAIAEVIEAPILWFVGQVRFQGNDDVPSSWEMQGIFTSREKAIAACRNEHYFVCPVESDSPFPDGTMSVDETTRSSFFPLVDEAARLDSLRVLGQVEE
jgi:hypothetical protein